MNQIQNKQNPEEIQGLPENFTNLDDKNPPTKNLRILSDVYK
jgi:hypothetical protein